MSAPAFNIVPVSETLFCVDSAAELDHSAIRACEQALTIAEAHPHVLIHELFLSSGVRTFFERDWHAVLPKGAPKA